MFFVVAAAFLQEDFGMGAFAGALAAASTTPLDVIKTRMMCAAAQRPTMASSARDIMAVHGPKGFLTGACCCGSWGYGLNRASCDAAVLVALACWAECR
jgi:solute carrier family 25 S-adenosylmethionine transporter 26